MELMDFIVDFLPLFMFLTYGCTTWPNLSEIGKFIKTSPSLFNFDLKLLLKKTDLKPTIYFLYKILLISFCRKIFKVISFLKQ